MSAPLSQRHGEACRFEHMQCMQCRRFECLHSPRWHLCRQPFHQMSCWKLIIFHHGWIYKPLILWACMGNSTLWIKETSTPQGPLIAHTHGHTVTTSSREAIDSVGMCWLQAYLINSMCLPSWHIFFFLTQWWCEGFFRARRRKEKGRGKFCSCRPSEALEGTRQLWDGRDAQGGWALDMSRLRIKPLKIWRRSWLRKILKGGRQAPFSL